MSQPLDAILVTFDRAASLERTCRSALDQGLPPRTLVVVDNNPTPSASTVLRGLDHPATEIRFLHTGENLGPAGGYAAGFRFLRRRERDLGWVLLLDDDDPLPGDDIAGQLLGALPEDALRVAGIALMGGRFSRRLLLPRPIDPASSAMIEVDALFGWAAPLYRASALEQVGGFRPELFWGFEELDLGLRLRRAGWTLQVAADVFRRLPTPAKALQRPGRPRLAVAEPTPRQYYGLRNTLDIGRRYFSATDVFLAAAVRGIAKPLASFPLHPRRAIRSLRLNWRAIADARRGRLGRTLDLDP
jgi:glycosyltransferase involved in cell wall biosynthesis